MSWLGVAPLKKFPGQILKPMWPFYVAGVVVLYGINSAANAMMDTDEWRNDPRNKRAQSKPAASGGH